MKKFWQTIMEKTTKFDLLFFGLIIVALLVFTFVMPPLQKPDENIHYQRAMTVANGYLSCPSAEVNIDSRYANFLKILGVMPFNYDEKFYLSDFATVADADDGATAIECADGLQVLSYLPSALVLKLSSFIAGPKAPVMGFYAARVLNAILFLISLIIAFYWLPKKWKPTFYLMATVPMVLHQVSAISYDAALISLSIMLFAKTLFLFEKFAADKKVTQKDFIIYLILLILIQWVKPGYYFLFLLFFLFPFKQIFKKSSWRRYCLIVIGFCLCFFMPLLKNVVVYYHDYFLNTFVNDGNEMVSTETVTNENEIVISPSKQISFLFNNPEVWPVIIQVNWRIWAFHYFKSAVGIFGWLDTDLSSGTYVVYIILSVLVLIYQTKLLSGEKEFSNKQIMLFGLTSLLTTLLLFGIFLLTVTPAGTVLIRGVQGRYFLPIAPFILIFLVAVFRKLSLKKCFYFFIALAILLIGADVMKAIDNRYWNYDLKSVTSVEEMEATDEAEIK